MTENEAKTKCCCFTGHRPEKLFSTMEDMKTVEAEMKTKLKTAIRTAIADGFEIFITGMARGLDLWAADVVLEEKKSYPHLRLICAIPFEGFEKRWNVSDRRHYHMILSRADRVQIVCEHYSMSCFQIRNEYMVDRANRVIAAYNGTSGGTRNTVNYARRCGVFVVNILED